MGLGFGYLGFGFVIMGLGLNFVVEDKGLFFGVVLVVGFGFVDDIVYCYFIVLLIVIKYK